MEMDYGRISPEEQVDALRTLVALSNTSRRDAERPPLNRVSDELLDVVEGLDPENASALADLLFVLAWRAADTVGGMQAPVQFLLRTSGVLMTEGAEAEDLDYILDRLPGRPALDAIRADIRLAMQQAHAATEGRGVERVEKAAVGAAISLGEAVAERLGDPLDMDNRQRAAGILATAAAAVLLMRLDT